LSENGPVFLFLTCAFLIYISLSSKPIFIHQSGIKCHFGGGGLSRRCPLMPQWYNCVFVGLEIGDVQAWAKPFVRKSGIKPYSALPYLQMLQWNKLFVNFHLQQCNRIAVEAG